MASIEVLNTTQANVEAPVEIQLSLGNPIYRGPEGKPGKDGVIGRDGKSAYEIAVENGFEGTETEWLESLKGADGTIGRDGAVGPQGEKGDTPVKGVDYFTEQDIQDFIAQIPEPNLSSYATKAEVETAIRGAETGLLKRAVVQELPVSDIDDNTIYMMPKTGSTNDVYDEYLYVNNNWEHIGSTDVDLTGYRKTYSFPANASLTQEQIDILAECYTLVEGNYNTTIRDLPFGLYIENFPVWGIRSSGDKQLSFYTWTVSVGTFGTDMSFPATEYYYTFNKTSNGAYPTQLTRNTSSMRADGLVITYGNTLNGNTEQQIGSAFSYIKNNYVKTADMPAYLTNSDVLAIWNGENN